MRSLTEDQRIGFIQREVKQAKQELDLFNEAKGISALDLMLDQDQIERHILSAGLMYREKARFSRRLDYGRNAWQLVAVLHFLIHPFISIPILDWSGRDDLMLAVVALSLVVTGVCFLAIKPSGFARALKRKKLKSESGRILRENQEHAEYNRDLAENADARYTKVKKRLEDLRLIYQQVYPGRILAISDDKSCVVEVHSDSMMQDILGFQTSLATRG